MLDQGSENLLQGRIALCAALCLWFFFFKKMCVCISVCACVYARAGMPAHAMAFVEVGVQLWFSPFTSHEFWYQTQVSGLAGGAPSPEEPTHWPLLYLRLGLVLGIRLTWNLWSSCLRLPAAGIIGVVTPPGFLLSLRVLFDVTLWVCVITAGFLLRCMTLRPVPFPLSLELDGYFCGLEEIKRKFINWKYCFSFFLSVSSNCTFVFRLFSGCLWGA